jgi:hypothetical protein
MVTSRSRWEIGRESARNKANGDISRVNSGKCWNKARCFARDISGSPSKESKMGKHEEHRIANTVVKIAFRTFGAGEEGVAVDIHNATAATMKRSGKEWNT